MDGLVVADALRHHHPRCAIVLMTEDLTPELDRRARERGIAWVLKKPFSLETLVATIRDALDHSRVSSGAVTGPGETGAPPA